MTELEALQQELEAHEWRFAKTMPDNPHEYTLKKSWDDPREFEWTCLMIRARGKKRKFNGSTYIELDLPPARSAAPGVPRYTYWSMGWPCRPKPGYPPHNATELINRKRIVDEDV